MARLKMRSWILLVAALAAAVPPALAQPSGLQVSDISKLRSVGDVQVSPDGRTVVYAVVNNDRPGRPYSQVWLLDVATGQSRRLGTDRDNASEPRFSPNGRRLAYVARTNDGAGIVVTRADGSSPQFMAPIEGTNHPLPSSGDRLTWSPDSTRLAFVSATPGPEADANGDPMVITRYLYKPTASEGETRANDNRRLHIFVLDIASKEVRQLTDGVYYEHSITWSPTSNQILFVSNRGPDPDRFFNYDVFAVDVATAVIRRLTDTKSAEYYPRWSPDGRWIAFSGTKRPLTSSETTMEDTHVWIMGSDGAGRREVGEGGDNRQGAPEWSADGKHLYFSMQERGHVRLLRLPLETGKAPERLVDARGSVGDWALAANGTMAYAFTSATSPAELFVRSPGGEVRKLTNLNDEILKQRSIAEVEAFTFSSFDGMEIEAFLTKPVSIAAGQKAPLITMIHGGPHGQQGPGFNQKAQAYAAHGFATLMVNYRGSTGYGQKLTDAIFQDQNGGEAKDVLAGVDAALSRYDWIDRARLGVEGGSYGGQLTNWLITQTTRFQAAIPSAGISNLVSFNYMAYYHDYLAVEFGGLPHEEFKPVDRKLWPAPPKTIMDVLWERSPIRYVAQAKTPTLFLHGENDNDVPIAEAEQFFIALKEAGVETTMVRYPREGHGIREVKHIEDVITRSIEWYTKHFDVANTNRHQ